jgi:hypothetical protein
MTTPPPKKVQADWVSKTLAGALLGFGLGVGCSAVFSALALGLPLAIRGQLAMWLVAPIWVGCLSGVYFFQSGRHAWTWLAAANLLVLGIQAALRLL